MRDPVLQRILDTVGLRELSRRLGLSPNSVIKWRRVPDHRIVQVEDVTGVPRETLRPDLYRKPTRTKKTVLRGVAA